MQITGNSCPMPVEVRRCIKMAKAILGSGRIFICDQDALDFGDRDPIKILEFLKLKSSKNVIFTIMRSFEEILKYKQVLFMEEGRVS